MVWNSNCDHFTYISFKKYLGSKDLKTSCILVHPRSHIFTTSVRNVRRPPLFVDEKWQVIIPRGNCPSTAPSWLLTRYKAKRGNTALPLLGGSDRPGSQAACRLLLGGGRMRPFKLQMLMWLMFPKTTPMPWSMGSSISKTQLCLCWHFSMKLKSAFSTTRSEVKISGKTSFNFGLFRWVETWIWPNQP